MKWAHTSILVGTLTVAGGCFPGTAPPPASPMPTAMIASPAATTFAPWAPAGPPLWRIPTEVAFNGPPLPEDVPTGIALYQPYLDQFSWQMFIAVNWPACSTGDKDCKAGEPDKGTWIGASGDAPTVWEQWMNVDDVFRKDGALPLPWGSEDVPPACKGKIKDDRGPVFAVTDGSATSHNNPALEPDVPFDSRATGPLIDQHRRWARFESYLNEAAYDYIVENKLYNLAGQKAFARGGKPISFPPTLADPDRAAFAIETKAVWKILDAKDDRSRYHTADGLLVEANGTCSRVPVALTAMHIMSKTQRTPMRVWSTFEHVDNLCRFKKDKKGYTYASGAFCNAECRDDPTKEGCAPNKPPKKPWKPPAHPADPGTTPSTQVARVRPLSLGAMQINSLMSTFLAGIYDKSVWQNYELVSTQWVLPLVSDLNSTTYREYLTIPDSGPAPQYFPRIKGEKACNKDPLLLGNDPACVGLVVPSILGNSLIETYNQAGASCLGCHETAKTKAGLNADFSFVLLRAQ